ncbi:MAG: glutathione S-transferase family protein [Myxococcota bacterium]
MKLYLFPVAPNPTRVRLYLAEKRAGGADIDLSEELVNLREAEQKSPEHLARNPFGNLPVLELDDGSFLRESLAIIEYLEELHPEPPMIGKGPLERARTRMLERTAEISVLAPVSRIVHATNSPLGLPPNPGVAEQARAALPPALAVLEAQLADGRPFLAGSSPTVADCTLAAAFQFARFGKVEIDPALTHLARWDEAFRARPAAQTVIVA